MLHAVLLASYKFSWSVLQGFALTCGQKLTLCEPLHSSVGTAKGGPSLSNVALLRASLVGTALVTSCLIMLRPQSCRNSRRLLYGSHKHQHCPAPDTVIAC